MMKVAIFWCACSFGVSPMNAQEFISEPVGREIITVQDGFNYLGIRFHQKSVSLGDAATVTSGSATMAFDEGVVDSLTIGSDYLFEVKSGDALGAVIPIVSFDSIANTLTLSDDISADFQNGDDFLIRPTSTLASVFGENNSAGLDTGFATEGGDQVLIPDANGGFDKYYYDAYHSEWLNVDTGTIVDPHLILIYYPEGIAMVGASPVNTFSVTGVIKKTPVHYALETGLSYLSTVYPSGSTLATLFGVNNSAGLDPGFGAPGGDEIWVPVLGISGVFTKYYYDDLYALWMNKDTGNAVDPATVSFDSISGIMFNNSGSAQSVSGGVPSFYGSL